MPVVDWGMTSHVRYEIHMSHKARKGGCRNLHSQSVKDSKKIRCRDLNV